MVKFSGRLWVETRLCSRLVLRLGLMLKRGSYLGLVFRVRAMIRVI